ncbi:MAG: hypothetical protein ACJ8FY_23385 [Gemmataceae bacterium]
MPSELHPLTPALGNRIASAIRAGAFPHVAAEAYGLPRSLYDQYLDLGNQPDAAPLYREFADGIRQAIAQARLKAEFIVLAEDAKFWLKFGPGKGTEKRPGWTNPAKAEEADGGEFALAAHPELLRLFSQILKSLEPFPEARSSMVKTLLENGALEANP